MQTQLVLLSEIRTDGGTQARVGMDASIVAEYAAAIQDGAKFPPVILFQEGDAYWIGDGYHRIHAALRVPEKLDIEATTHPGTRRDAILYAVEANLRHGMRPSTTDRHQSVRMLLEDEEWRKWSDREIARRCGVSPTTVGTARAQLSNLDRCETRKAQRNGTTYEIHTEGINAERIGKPAPDPAPLPDPDPPIECDPGDTTEEDDDDALLDPGTPDEWDELAEAPEDASYLAARKAEHDATAYAEEEAEVPKKKHHVTQNTGHIEWYTPPEYIEAARLCMSEITLDPASCEFANRTVQAEHFFSLGDDGLQQSWFGRVWLNPPYADGMIGPFAQKFIDEWDAERIIEAILLVNNATETAWFQLLLTRASRLCLPKGRIKFLNEQGKPENSPTQGQAILYFGESPYEFQQCFRRFGPILEVLQ